MRQFKYKIFYLQPPLSAHDTLNDWQSDRYALFNHTSDINEVLNQPYRIAAVPAMFNVPGNFAYNEALINVDWSKFDLVIISEIETITFEEIHEKCIVPMGIKNYLLALGTFQYDLNYKNIIYRPWWLIRHVELNARKKIKHTENYTKPFLFEALLGQGRPHRHYVMARFQKNQDLLNKSIVMYRGFFGGATYEHSERTDLRDEIAKVLDGESALFPYESPNLKPEWEVVSPYGLELDRGISEITPWEIYNQTYYSIVCETNWYNPTPNPGKPLVDTPGPFFITEKMAKVLLGHRLFVMFGPMHILKFFREQGFKTFDNIIDESYDECSNIPERFRRAFDQVEYLATLDPKEVLQATEEVRKHNFKHLYNYRSIKKNEMHELILNTIPDVYLFKNLDVSLPELENDELIRTRWS